MLHNLNPITTYTGQLIEDSYTIPKKFESDLDKHTIEIQPFTFLSLAVGINPDWRKYRLQTPEIPEGVRSYHYNPLMDPTPDFDKLQTYWYTVEQLRLELLEKNPTWVSEKLINLVPKGTLS